MYEYEKINSETLIDSVAYDRIIENIEELRYQQQNQQQLLLAMKNDIYHSTAIEGNTMSKIQMALAVEHGITIRGKTLKEHLQVINYAEMLNEIKKILQNKDFTLSEESIKQVHHIVTMGELPLCESGQYRQEPVHIRYTDYIPPMETEVADYINELCEMYYRPLGVDTQFERICEFKLNFERIHPFIDGNGRTGRLLMNMLFLQEGYSYISFPLEERDIYFECLDNGNFVEYAAPKMQLALEKCLTKEKERNMGYER